MQSVQKSELHYMHYVCSDIHGQYDLYQQLLQQLNLQKSDTLYIIGDVIDRGPDSLAILKDIMGRKNVELFLGNHELMMLDYYDGEGLPESWMRPSNGGELTYRQIEKLTEEEKSGIKAFVRNAWIQKYVTAGDVSYALHHSFWLPEQEKLQKSCRRKTLPVFRPSPRLSMETAISSTSTAAAH